MGAVVENDTFPVESGTLHLTALLPPCSLSSSGGPGFLAVGGQEDEKKKKKKKGKKGNHCSPSWVGSSLEACGAVALGDRPSPRLALARSLLLSLRAPGWWPRVERRQTGGISDCPPGIPGTHRATGLACACQGACLRSGLGDIISRKRGCFEKGTQSGWVAPAKKHPKQKSKTNGEEKAL